MPIKVVDLPSEEAPTDDDFLLIRDNLTGTTRKVTRSKFFENPPIPDDAITTDMIADESITKAKLAADAKISVRSLTQSSPGTLTPDSDNYDAFNVTNLASGMTIAAPTGTPVNNQGILFRFKDNGSTRALTWNAVYRAVGVTIPTSTVAGKLVYIMARYNTESLKWDVLSVGREA